MTNTMAEFKERIKITKILEKLHHMEDDMVKLNHVVESETDEKKRVSAWEALKALDRKCALYAAKHCLMYTCPREIRW